MLDLVRDAPARAAEHFERYRFRDAVAEVMNLARAANKYFNDSEPWKTAKSNPVECATTIGISLQTTRALAVLMHPVVPSASERLWRMLALPARRGTGLERRREPALDEGHALGQSEILFTKIEDEVIEAELKKVGVPPGETGTAGEAPPRQPERARHKPGRTQARAPGSSQKPANDAR